MRAMVINDFGGTELFQEKDIPKPIPQTNEILVKVFATSVNPVDYKIRQNGSWAGIKFPAILGYDVAGVVESIGHGVKKFKPGDEVFYTPHIFGHQGSYAEYHVTDESIVSRKPIGLSFEQAASIPLAGGTAWDCVIGLMKVRPGETILVHAGSGGVGSLAIQMAKASGARVITTCSPNNFEFVRSLGADVLIDYHTTDFIQSCLHETNGEGVDCVVDTVGNDTLARSIQCTRKYGRLSSIVNTEGNLNIAYQKNITVYFEFLERKGYKMEALKTLLDRSLIRPVIDSILPLNQVAEAHRKLEKGGVRGKIVLSVASS